MSWEVARHDWALLRTGNGVAGKVGEAFHELENAHSSEQAKTAYWGIDNVVIVQGALFEASVAAAACGVAILSASSTHSRRWVLELLVQLGNGETAPAEVQAGSGDLRVQCIHELRWGFSVFAHVLETSIDDDERSLCLDLLGLCCLEEPSLRGRVEWILRRFLDESRDPHMMDLASGWLNAIVK